MKENDFINTIKNLIGYEFIGDDCAYLKDFGIVVSQDSLVEDIHFKRNWYTPYQLGKKAMTVNISDILASGAKPKYATIAISLPKDTTNSFVEDFYKGAIDASYGAKIVGGDITGAEKILISVTVIGSTKGRKISSRKNAKPGYVIITHGKYGSSAAGLQELLADSPIKKFTKSHIEPSVNENFSKEIACKINQNYAMMDTSDGLADALFKIAESSNVTLEIDYDKIPHSKDIEDFDTILFGGEDYNLVAAVPEDFLKNIDNYKVIGKVKIKTNDIFLSINKHSYTSYNELKVFKHF